MAFPSLLVGSNRLLKGNTDGRVSDRRFPFRIARVVLKALFHRPELVDDDPIVADFRGPVNGQFAVTGGVFSFDINIFKGAHRREADLRLLEPLVPEVFGLKRSRPVRADTADAALRVFVGKPDRS
jgi:hypothetical protein